MSAWPEIRQEIALEFERLDRVLNRHPGLIAKCASTPPSDLEIDALASMLHSFYTGVENIFKRISVGAEGKVHKGEAWHSRLLLAMTQPASGRPAVITPPTQTVLLGYLNFRHVFRHAYTQELNWSKMAPLVLAAPEALQAVQREVMRFLDRIQY